MKSFEEVLTKINKESLLTVAIAAAEDEDVLIAVKKALEIGLAKFHLVGNQDQIEKICSTISLSLDQVTITNEPNPVNASLKAVELVSSGQCQILMKGLLPTSTILKAVLNKEIGLRTGRILSHVAVFDLPAFNRFIFLTDAAMNIAPDLSQKAGIIQNAVDLAKSLGISTPKVAPIAAVETVNPDMQATLDASLLSKMADRGQIKDAIVDGPLALDIAISVEAAKHKGIKSEVAGHADILLVPTIEVGNALYKSLIYFSNAKVGAVVTGAKAPIVLTSRADSPEAKVNSIALAILVAQNNAI